MAGRNSSYLLLPSGTVGTISELEVALDLLKKGYEVYRPVTPNCSGDFMIEKNFEWNKIEVKTGYQHLKNKTIIFSKKNIRTKLLAIVIPRLKEIRYFSFPSMEAIEI